MHIAPTIHQGDAGLMQLDHFNAGSLKQFYTVGVIHHFSYLLKKFVTVIFIDNVKFVDRISERDFSRRQFNMHYNDFLILLSFHTCSMCPRFTTIIINIDGRVRHYRPNYNTDRISPGKGRPGRKSKACGEKKQEEFTFRKMK